MGKLEIYDPVMCCPTGVCGPSVDPDLTRIASALFLLKGKGIEVNRYGLANEADQFITNKKVNLLLNEKGEDALPLVFVNGQLKKQGSYPANSELASWLGVGEDELAAPKAKKNLL